MKRNSEAGQALVVIALVLVILLSVLGLAIDMGYLRFMKRQLQTAADAAAIAGALDIGSCGGSPGCSNLVDAAQKASGENGFTDGANGVTVTVNNPPTTSGDPHNGDSNYVEVLVSQPEPTHFANIFGVSSTTLTARGEARLSNGNCIYTLNDFDLTVALALKSQCGIVVEQDLDCVGGSITAPRIGIVHASGSLACSTSPNPVNIAKPTPADPLAYLPAPTPGGCIPSNNPITGGTPTLSPGTYCGGIKISGGTVTFNPGVYVLNGGGLSVTAGSLTGSGVTFFNTGSGPGSCANCYGPISLTLTTTTLSAPTSGPYKGILFFQNADNTQPASFLGAPLPLGSSMTGGYYFPGATIQFSVDLGASAPYTIIVAKDLSFSVVAGFTVNNDYSSLANGSPVKDVAVLVE
jgi:hypothetical protein